MQANKNFSTAIQICVFMDYKGDGRYSSQELADSVMTNPVVIRRQLGRLRAAGIMQSQNGPNGGYYLVRPADVLTLWDLYMATRDGEFFNRPKPNPDCVVGSNLKYLVSEAFDAAEMAMKPELEVVTIRELSEKLKNLLNC